MTMSPLDGAGGVGLARLSDLGRLLARLCLKAAHAGGWEGLVEDSQYLPPARRPRTFAQLLSHADKLDPEDKELRQLYSLLLEVIPDELGGRWNNKYN